MWKADKTGTNIGRRVRRQYLCQKTIVEADEDLNEEIELEEGEIPAKDGVENPSYEEWVGQVITEDGDDSAIQEDNRSVPEYDNDPTPDDYALNSE